MSAKPLFGDEPEAKKPKKRKPKGEADARIQVCIDAFHDEFLKTKGFKVPGGQWGRFGKEVKPLLDAWGLDEVLRLIQVFFWTNDPHVIRTDWKPCDFTRLAQRLKLNEHGSGRIADHRTASNIHAAQQATRRRA